MGGFLRKCLNPLMFWVKKKSSYTVYILICFTTYCRCHQLCLLLLSVSPFFTHTCAIMLPLPSAAKIFMAIIYQQDSCRENSVCSQALNELTFHEHPRVYWWAPVCLKVFFWVPPNETTTDPSRIYSAMHKNIRVKRGVVCSETQERLQRTSPLSKH